MEDRIEQTRNLYDSFVFGGDAGALGVAEKQLDAVRADLALARGRIVHGRFLEKGDVDPRELALFEQALVLFQAIGDVRGEAESHFWIGIYHQVVEGNEHAAVPAFERSHTLAKQIDDRRTMSYALRHLGIAAHAAGRLDTARAHLEESIRLRKELGHLPGVAANMVGLAYIAAGQGRHDDARAIIDEARAIAVASEAHGTLRSIEEAHAAIAS
ncbi:tetratricopeptide repeat protein [Asanoa sp. NPDC049518]|uniref:tetratricopeptide repeat protein n=1 Tax=unclassified Asanoa TaxID=2685164 RepID=UPI0034342EE4